MKFKVWNANASEELEADHPAQALIDFLKLHPGERKNEIKLEQLDGYIRGGKFPSGMFSPRQEEL